MKHTDSPVKHTDWQLITRAVQDSHPPPLRKRADCNFCNILQVFPALAAKFRLKVIGGQDWVSLLASAWATPGHVPAVHRHSKNTGDCSELQVSELWQEQVQCWDLTDITDHCTYLFATTTRRSAVVHPCSKVFSPSSKLFYILHEPLEDLNFSTFVWRLISYLTENIAGFD
jgi:hypothetical protein